MPSLIERTTWDQWVALGSKDMYVKAHEKVEEILASDIKHPLEHNVKKEIDEIVEEATFKL